MTYINRYIYIYKYEGVFNNVKLPQKKKKHVLIDIVRFYTLDDSFDFFEFFLDNLDNFLFIFLILDRVPL